MNACAHLREEGAVVHPRKRARMLGRREVVVVGKSDHPQKRARMLVFEGGGGVNVGHRAPSLSCSEWVYLVGGWVHM